ncbi:8-oxo-dGDP phosphatase NUDT18-like [Sinocyclocheilus rhinocerous]|uniref:8-oxo-dGDP phosphatase NUDT18 n=1 Tax=Sinocyclocheilus rhinocerous TaxID=307959 RepID=A0A673MGY1_9TELE|nr:PREDICTED: 8-oxo-dGDP phosphatase NUDT18-like [Sinocyclocheilus rhinocerous]XP_016429627.1 PREDICTED: 8-oxo-dGDP phosphatase NUDT18-like [Sinocyclocheilus rhinocerous]
MNSTAEILEDNLEKILKGEGLEVREFDSVPEQVKPVTLRKSVCYIVGAVIFNSKDEVLMVQEAKRECYGRWYLPAGRMEERESILEALQREVKEEAGIDCQPITLLLVQEQGPKWVRFVFLAEETGGSLKTTAEADSESLQAQWWDRESPLPLRGRDILPLIDAGIKYRRNPWFPMLQPVDFPCQVICQRLFLTFISCNGNTDTSDEHRLWLLMSSNDATSQPSLPIALSVNAFDTIPRAAHRLVKECVPSSSMQVHTCGILGVQHNGRIPGKTDGVCFNTLVLLENSEDGAEISSPPPLEGDAYRWHEVTNQSLSSKIIQRIKEESVLPVHSLY